MITAPQYSFKYTSPLICDENVTRYFLRYPNQEIYKIGARAIPYPMSGVSCELSEFESVTCSDNPAVQVGDKHLPILALFAPIILNFRLDAPANAATTLNPSELQYLKANGNQAVIFIHGFNVPFGTYARQIDDAVVGTQIINHAAHQITTIQVANPVYNPFQSTIYRGADYLQEFFPALQQAGIKPGADFDSDVVNGTDAHNWFVHMEDNFNRATQQYDRHYYGKYQRLVHIAWSGDVGIANYMDSEDRANAAGHKLVPLLKQLIAAGLEVNLIAHSMGNRVLLTALNQLGSDTAYAEKINHIFMWDAAVPNTALSNESGKDKSYRQNCSFPNATKAVKKITVLYSQQDDVLGLGYPFMNRGYNIAREIAVEGNIAKQQLTALEKQLDTQGTIKHPKITPEQENARVLPALGYSGPDLTDDSIKKMLRDNKLIRADLTKWGVGHSHMRIPTSDVMTYGYKKWILNQTYGLKNFGLYDGTQFTKD